MKTQLGLQVTPEEAELIRNKASELGVAQGTLVGFAVRFAMDRCPPEALTKWAQANRPQFGRKLVNGMSKRERDVYAAFVPLMANADGGWRFDATQIGAAASCRPVEALGALYALAGRGLVHSVDIARGEVDNWGRPKGLQWARVDMIPEPARSRLREQCPELAWGSP